MRFVVALALVGIVGWWGWVNFIGPNFAIPGDEFDSECRSALRGIDVSFAEDFVPTNPFGSTDIAVACEGLLGMYRASGCDLGAAIDHVELFAQNKIETISSFGLSLDEYCEEYPESARRIRAVPTTVPDPWTVIGSCVRYDVLKGGDAVGEPLSDCRPDEAEIVAVVSHLEACPVNATSYVTLDDGRFVCLLER